MLPLSGANQHELESGASGGSAWPDSGFEKIHGLCVSEAKISRVATRPRSLQSQLEKNGSRGTGWILATRGVASGPSTPDARARKSTEQASGPIKQSNSKHIGVGPKGASSVRTEAPFFLSSTRCCAEFRRRFEGAGLPGFPGRLALAGTP